MNEDRHTNNIAVIYNEKTQKYELSPFFDQGLCMFADINQDYPIDQSLEYCLEKIEAKHLALILIYSWMQQKNCMAFRLVSNLHSKTFRYTYRKIWKIIQEFTDCLLKIWQGCAIILFVMPMHMIHCYCGWQGVKSNE